MKIHTGIETSFIGFSPRHYLQTYYSKIGEENEALLRFYSNCYLNSPRNSKLLEFSGGPTVYSIITAAARVGEIHFSDFLQSNLDEVFLWKMADKKAFNWRAYIHRALELEGVINPSIQDVINREELMRNKITKFLASDAFSNKPLGSGFDKYYDIINVNFVPESITSSINIWRKIVRNICAMLKDRGSLVITAIKGANYYKVGEKKFPAVNISVNNLLELLGTLGFDKRKMRLTEIPAEIVDVEEGGFTGYTGMIFIEISKST